MMKLVAILCMLLAVVQAFVPSTTNSAAIVSRRSSTAPATSSALKMAADAPTYWEGEWVCADCGYIYDRDDCGGLYFEQQVDP